MPANPPSTNDDCRNGCKSCPSRFSFLSDEAHRPTADNPHCCRTEGPLYNSRSLHIHGKSRAASDFPGPDSARLLDRKSTRLNSSHVAISYAVFCLKKKNDLLVNYDFELDKDYVKHDNFMRIYCVYKIII